MSTLADHLNRRRGFEGASRAAVRPEVFYDTEHQLRLANYEGNRLVQRVLGIRGRQKGLPGESKAPGARADTSKLRHLNSRVANAELGAAQRYLAAGRARNEAIVHMSMTTHSRTRTISS